jgi:hypothetical protein
MPAAGAGASWTTSCISKAKLLATHEAFKFLVDDDTFHSASTPGALAAEPDKTKKVLKVEVHRTGAAAGETPEVTLCLTPDSLPSPPLSPFP